MTDFLKAEAAAPAGTRLALIDGELVEWGANLTTRKPRHSMTMSWIAYQLQKWLATRGDLPGVVAGGQARCRLTRNPDRVLGLDLGLFFGPEHQLASCHEGHFEGPPAVAIEILSGSDTHDDVVERIRILLDSGVSQVWIVDAELRQVTIHRAAGEATFFTAKQELTAEPELPGFRVPVAELFPPSPVQA
jgi:Uma2 family endonuclease